MLQSFLSIVFIYLIGLALLKSVNSKLSVAESIGFSFPIGIGIITFCMFLLNLSGILLTSGILLICNSVLVIALFCYLGVRKKMNIFYFVRDYYRNNTFKSFIAKQNIGTLLIILAIGYLTYLVGVKTLFWPAIHYDTIAGYDFLAKAITREGTINNSLFNPEYNLISYRSIYPPLFPYSFAYCYITGVSAKCIPLLFYISISFSFYGLLRKYVNPFLSSLGVLVLISVPEFAAQSTFLMTNMPQTAYTLIGVISFICWFQNKGDFYINVSILALTLGVWGRTEGVVFFLPCFFAILYRVWQNRKQIPLFKWTNLTLCFKFGAPPTFVYIVWELYLKYSLKAAELKQPFKLGVIDLDGKFDFMIKTVKEISFNTQLYGVVIYVFFIILLINIGLSVYKRKLQYISPLTLIIIIATWCIYLAVYYQIDIHSIEVFSGYINNGYKRGLFNFLPLLLFYCFTSTSIQKTIGLLYCQYNSLSKQLPEQKRKK